MFNTNGHMTIGDWFVFHFLMVIPGVNIIMFIVLLFSSNTNPSLKSYLALPIIMGLIVVIGFVILMALGYSLHTNGGIVHVF